MPVRFFLYVVGYPAVFQSARPFMTDHEFAEVARLLEETLSELKQSRDPQLRRIMLADMRLLLSEADRLLAEHASPKECHSS
jgi:hypothetical protein